MDIVELLVLLAFVLFPLLQGLLEKLGTGRRSDDPAEPEADRRDESEEPGAGVATVEQASPAGPALPNKESGWSSGWGAWPAESIEELAAEEVVTEEEADELIAYQERLSRRQASEAARVTVPVVSMEPLEIDRSAEHRRFHATVAAERPRSPLRTPQPLRRALRQPDELKRAILLAEVLGPPRARQPLDRRLGA